MHDDLYGHTLNAGEEVVFAGHASGKMTGHILMTSLIVMFIIVPKGAERLGTTHVPESDLTLIVALVLLILLAIDRLDGVLRCYRPNDRRLPALITNQRVIAPDGLDIPLSNISKVHGRWSTVKLDGQKLADGLTIRDMQDARAFRTAIERHLA